MFRRHLWIFACDCVLSHAYTIMRVRDEVKSAAKLGQRVSSAIFAPGDEYSFAPPSKNAADLPSFEFGIDPKKGGATERLHKGVSTPVVNNALTTKLCG